MQYADALKYLYAKLPMFSKVGSIAIKPGLKNIYALCQALGNPQQRLKCIHIAGTNGKGSTSHMLAACLQQNGYSTGLYTSPHLLSFRERIKINGTEIPETEVANFVTEYQQLIEKIQPSFFEITVAMAFTYFAGQHVDIAVIETGLGGTYDSTNIITPILSIITNISYDHTAVLGNSITEIADAKAGIIKHKVPVLIGERNPHTDAVFINKADQSRAPIAFATDMLTASQGDDTTIYTVRDNLDGSVSQYNLDLTGNYQTLNLQTVLSAVKLLNEYTAIKVTDENTRKALSHVCDITNFQGRWQILSDEPLVIADTGHNYAGIQFITQQLAKIETPQLHIVFGVVADKDLSSILPLLPSHAIYYFCAPHLPRALNAYELQQAAAAYNLRGNTYPSVAHALTAALTNAKENNVIFTGGSTFVVAEVLGYYSGQIPES